MSLPAQIPRIPWTPEEDAELTRAVEQHGDKRWSQISTYLPGRTSKACSHRWRTYLQPGVMHASSVPFNEWEKAVVKEAHRQIGNNWAMIARMLPGRTNAAVKNFWYQLRRRSGRTQGRQQPGAGASGGADADGGWDSDEEGEDVSSADEMDCEDDCEVDDVMAGADYGFDPKHAMEGVDCSASWQQMAGSNAAAGASWVQPQQEHPAGCTEGLIAHTHAGTAAPADQFTPGPNRWPFAAGPEMHGSSGGAGSNTQPPLDQPCQQHMMQQAAQQPHHLQQQDMRSCTPRRSSHHSWSGAPRSFPGGAGAASSWAELSGGFEGPAVPEVWSNLPQQLQGVPSSAAAAADGTLPPMVGRVSQPRLSGHGFLDPHHLGARASSRFTSSNQLFEVQTAPLPFSELHSAGQVTPSATAAGAAAPVKAEPQGPQARLEKPYRFALDLSAIDESEPDAHPTAAAAAAAVEQDLYMAAAAAASSGAAKPEQLDSGRDCSSLGCDRMAGSSSGKSTDMQPDWPAVTEQQGFMDGATIAIKEEQQGELGQQQQQQGRKRVLEQHQHTLLLMPHAAEQQDAAAHGHMFPPRKLVRPSLCSDAGTVPQQQAAAATAGAADTGALMQAASSNSGALSTGSRRFVLDLSDDALAA